MSDKLVQFQEQAAGLPEMQREIAASAGDLKALAEIARKAGHDVSFEEVKADLEASVAKTREKPEV